MRRRFHSIRKLSRKVERGGKDSVIEKQSREEEMQPIKKIIFRVLCSRHARKMKFRPLAHKLQKRKR